MVVKSESKSFMLGSNRNLYLFVGQWLWRSWQSSRFQNQYQYPRFESQHQLLIYLFICQLHDLGKTKNKEK